MVSLKIVEIKNFVSHLLIQNTFDHFLLSSASIHMKNSIAINGSVNRDFLSSEELEENSSDLFVEWQEIKGLCYQIIKGKRAPVGFKFVFLLSHTNTETVSYTHLASKASDYVTGCVLPVDGGYLVK